MNGAASREDFCYRQLGVGYLCESTFGKEENECKRGHKSKQSLWQLLKGEITDKNERKESR